MRRIDWLAVTVLLLFAVEMRFIGSSWRGWNLRMLHQLRFGAW